MTAIRERCPKDGGEVKLVTASMSALCRLAHVPQFVTVLATIMCEEEWDLMFSAAVSVAAPRVVESLSRQLQHAELVSVNWNALMKVFRVVTHAARRMRRAESEDPNLSFLVVHNFQLEDTHVQVILTALERMAASDAKSVTAVLRSIKMMIADSSVAAMFVSQRGSAAIREVSALHTQNLDLQHACVDLLASLSSPGAIYSHCE